MGLSVKGLNRWKFATVTLCLVVALLVSCFVVLYQPSFEASAKEPVLLNVSIDGPAKIGANAPTDYTARVFGGEGALTYSWSISPDDSNVLLEPDGGVCTLTFTTATEAPYTLEVTVHDAAGNFGVASMAVYDPPTYPNYYLGVSTAPYSYMIKTDNTGWYYAVNGSDGSVSWSSTNANTVIQNSIDALEAASFPRTLFLDLGNATVTGLTVTQPMEIYGLGRYQTRLTLATAGTMWTISSSNVAIHDIMLIGANDAAVAQNCIMTDTPATYYEHLDFYNLDIHYFISTGTSYAIKILTGIFSTIHNCHFWNNRQHVYIGGETMDTSIVISGNMFYQPADYSTYQLQIGSGATLCKVTQNVFEGGQNAVQISANSMVFTENSYESSATTRMDLNVTGSGNVIKNNPFTNNVSIADNNDVNTLTVPFNAGTEGLDKGFYINAVGEVAYTHVFLPTEVNRVLKIKVYAITNVTDADKMRVEFLFNGGASGEAYNRDVIYTASFASYTSNFAIGNVVYWVITPAQDADVNDLRGGDLFSAKMAGVTNSTADCATDAFFSTIVIEYV